MSKGIEALKSRTLTLRPMREAGDLYRWLLTNRVEIAEARENGATWGEVVQAARDDGLQLDTSVASRRALQRKWVRVRKVVANFERKRSAGIARSSESDAPQRVMPSRLPANWRPQFVEPAQSTALQPATVNAGQGAVPTLKKNALATTNFRAVASSDAEMTPAILEGKTLADIAAEEIEREMRIMANRQAGYFGDK
ncbi:hypothetical protein [Kozakia baliensis]|uniref:hypothetical protein n=1 Tax=Kozakia baliensis TaxID=153496 RepID=UPI00087CF0CF|nr:hypothetical protein [Kozakia baliensis]AOX21660.1 hypothetical protein A0U90_14260 [Kozakia baliensis]